MELLKNFLYPFVEIPAHTAKVHAALGDVGKVEFRELGERIEIRLDDWKPNDDTVLTRKFWKPVYMVTRWKKCGPSLFKRKWWWPWKY